MSFICLPMSRTRAERRHNTAVIKARREEICKNIWCHELSEGSSYYTPNGERKSDSWMVADKYYTRMYTPTRHNTVQDADFEDKVIHHKASTRTAPPKAKSPVGTPGRKGRNVYPGADYCPIDSAWAIAHAARVQAQMAAPPADIQYDEDRSDTWVTGLSIGMVEFMRSPAYALGRWNLGYRDADLSKVS